MSLIWSPSHMAVFAKVIDLNGFSAAARALRVPKAAVSRAIAELEAELGLRLMQRTTRRLSLTPAGEQLLPHCRAILAAADTVRERAAELAKSHVGALRVLADSTYGRVLLAPLVPRFMERFPDIPLEVDLGEVGLAAVGQYQLILQSGDSLPGEVDSGGWVRRVLGSPPSILCASPAYLGKNPSPQTPQGLLAMDVLTPETLGANFVLRLAQGLRREELALRPKLAVNDPALLHSAVAAGLGVGLLPEFLCRQGLATQKLKRVLGEWQPPLQPPLCAVYPARLAEDARLKSLVDFLAAHIVPALAG